MPTLAHTDQPPRQALTAGGVRFDRAEGHLERLWHFTPAKVRKATLVGIGAEAIGLGCCSCRPGFSAFAEHRAIMNAAFQLHGRPITRQPASTRKYFKGWPILDKKVNLLAPSHAVPCQCFALVDQVVLKGAGAGVIDTKAKPIPNLEPSCGCLAAISDPDSDRIGVVASIGKPLSGPASAHDLSSCQRQVRAVLADVGAAGLTDSACRRKGRDRRRNRSDPRAVYIR